MLFQRSEKDSAASLHSFETQVAATQYYGATKVCLEICKAASQS